MAENSLIYSNKIRKNTWVYKFLLFLSFAWISVYPVINASVLSFQVGYGNLFDPGVPSTIFTSVLIEALFAWASFDSSSPFYLTSTTKVLCNCYLTPQYSHFSQLKPLNFTSVKFCKFYEFWECKGLKVKNLWNINSLFIFFKFLFWWSLSI